MCWGNMENITLYTVWWLHHITFKKNYKKGNYYFFKEYIWSMFLRTCHVLNYFFFLRFLLYCWRSYLPLTYRSTLKCKASSLYEISVSLGQQAACCSFSKCYANLSFQLLLIVGFCSVNVEKRSMLRIQGRRRVREGCEKITSGIYVSAQLSMRQYGSPLLLLAFMLGCVNIWFSPSELPHPSHNFLKV